MMDPNNLAFFDRNWNSIGSKESKAEVIKALKFIPDIVLRDPSSLSSLAICARMS